MARSVTPGSTYREYAQKTSTLHMTDAESVWQLPADEDESGHLLRCYVTQIIVLFVGLTSCRCCCKGAHDCNQQAGDGITDRKTP